MNRYFPRYQRRWFEPNWYYGGDYYNSQFQAVNSQFNNVAQSIYNAGYMAGVTQNSVVNQTQNFGR